MMSNDDCGLFRVRFEGSFFKVGTGLFLASDGRQTWSALDFPGDFDGEDPSALCGEVVGFDPAHSATIAVSRDYFSRDGGVTIHRMSARAPARSAMSKNPAERLTGCAFIFPA